MLLAVVAATIHAAACASPHNGSGEASGARQGTGSPPLPESLQLPADYRTPLERTYGAQLVEVRPGAWLNVVDVGIERPRALVFVHGDAGSFDYWRPQIEYFKARYRVVAFERADCGRSTGPPDAITYSSSAEDIARLVSALRINSYVIIGHSRGQEIAAFHFAKAPKGLAGLVAEGTGVIVAPVPAARTEAARAVELHFRRVHDLRTDCYDELKPFVRRYGPVMGMSDGDALELVKYSCGRWRPAVGILGGPDIDVRAQLAAVDLPMLQIDGAAYRSGRDRRQTMQRFFRNGRLVMLDGVGHVAHLEAPAEFNGHVERFLTDIGFR